MAEETQQAGADHRHPSASGSHHRFQPLRGESSSNCAVDAIWMPYWETEYPTVRSSREMFQASSRARPSRCRALALAAIATPSATRLLGIARERHRHVVSEGPGGGTNAARPSLCSRTTRREAALLRIGRRAEAAGRHWSMPDSTARSSGRRRADDVRVPEAEGPEEGRWPVPRRRRRGEYRLSNRRLHAVRTRVHRSGRTPTRRAHSANGRRARPAVLPDFTAALPRALEEGVATRHTGGATHGGQNARRYAQQPESRRALHLEGQEAAVRGRRPGRKLGVLALRSRQAR